MSSEDKKDEDNFEKYKEFIDDLSKYKDLAKEFIEEKINFAKKTNTTLNVDELFELKDTIEYIKQKEKEKNNLEKLHKNGTEIFFGPSQNYNRIIKVNDYKDYSPSERLDAFINSFFVYDAKNNFKQSLNEEELLKEDDGSITTFFSEYDFKNLGIKYIASKIRPLYFMLKEKEKEEKLRLTNLEALLWNLEELLSTTEEVNGITINKKYKLTEDRYYLEFKEENRIINTPLGKVKERKVYNYDEKENLVHQERILENDSILFVERGNEKIYYTYNDKQLTEDDLKEL